MTPQPAPRIGLIWAQAQGGVIGHQGQMPWHLPEDLAHFKRTTLAHPVIMGRKTWDSLPPRFRPLPGRRNIVITRQTDWQAPGAERASSLPAALQLCADAAQVWIIGGAQIYAQALPLADELSITEIHAHFDGDAHAPTPGPEWLERSRQRHTAANGLAYSFVHLQRQDPA